MKGLRETRSSLLKQKQCWTNKRLDSFTGSSTPCWYKKPILTKPFTPNTSQVKVLFFKKISSERGVNGVTRTNFRNRTSSLYAKKKNTSVDINPNLCLKAPMQQVLLVQEHMIGVKSYRLFFLKYRCILVRIRDNCGQVSFWVCAHYGAASGGHFVFICRPQWVKKNSAASAQRGRG